MAQQEEIVAEVPAAEAPAVEVEEAPAAAAPEVVEETPATGFQMQPLLRDSSNRFRQPLDCKCPLLVCRSRTNFKRRPLSFARTRDTNSKPRKHGIRFSEFDPSILAAAASPGNGSTVELNYTTRDASLTKSKKKGQKVASASKFSSS